MTYWVLKVLLTPVLRAVYRVDIRGRSNVPKRGGVILASNHQSFIDSVFIPLSVRRRVTFLAKAEYFDKGTTAWFFRAMGQIPVRREGGSASEAAVAAARRVLDAGGMLGIYPEGTRSPDGRLYRGHTGVARMALTCGVPVVPVACSGTVEVQPVGAMRPRLFRRVRISFGPPLRWPELAGAADDRTVPPGAADDRTVPPGAAGDRTVPPGAAGDRTVPPGAAGDRTVPPGAAGDRAALRRVTDDIMDGIAALSGQERVDGYAKRASASGAPKPAVGSAG